MKTSLQDLLLKISTQLKPLWRYRLLAFILFVTGLCAYLVLQINHAVAAPTASSSDTSTAAANPKIDPKVVQQLKQLQDNSVSVKALFNQARENPFE